MEERLQEDAEDEHADDEAEGDADPAPAKRVQAERARGPRVRDREGEREADEGGVPDDGRDREVVVVEDVLRVLGADLAAEEAPRDEEDGQERPSSGTPPSSASRSPSRSRTHEPRARSA